MKNSIPFLQHLGYRGEIGYHNILYPNEGETRKILLFLDGLRPKEEQRGDAIREGCSFST
jgi:hypothetical protein